MTGNFMSDRNRAWKPEWIGVFKGFSDFMLLQLRIHGILKSFENTKSFGLYSRVRPDMKFPVIFWAESWFRLLIYHLPDLPRKAKINVHYIAFFDDLTFDYQIFRRPGSLQSPKTFYELIFKRSKAFLHEHHKMSKAFSCSSASSTAASTLLDTGHGLQRNSVFRQKICHFKVHGPESNVVQMSSFSYTFFWNQNLSF
jgi:hypothetical protein